MIKKIIACSDIHIRNLKRLDEASDYLTKFVSDCKDIVKEYGKDGVRILVLGDLFENKINISNESNLVVSWFLKELDKICKTIVIAGNHDMLQANGGGTQRIDSLLPIFTMSNYKNVLYLDKELGFESGFYVDDNIVWTLYSIFDKFNTPNSIPLTRIEHPDKKFIGLFHGMLIGSTTDIGMVSERGINPSAFEGLDFVCMGDIHKHQEIKKHGVKMVYCGSLMQQNFGENVSGHGYVVWDVETDTYTHIDIKLPEYGNYKFSITSIEDVEENKERLLNL